MNRALTLLVALLCVWVNVGDAISLAGIRLLQDEDDDGASGFVVNCESFASLQLLVTGGSCIGNARADCEVIQTIADEFDEAIIDWFAVGICDADSRLNATELISRSVAKVWANAFVKVVCDGLGFGCGFSVAGTADWENELVRILKSVTDAELRKDDVEGFCFQDLENIVREVGLSVERARAEACTEGSTQEDFEAVYTTLILDDVFQAFENASLLECTGTQSASCQDGGPAPATADEPSDDPSDDATASDSEASGDAPDTSTQCPEAVQQRCCGPVNGRRNVCICRGCANPLRKPESAPSDGVVRWQDSDGVICACPSS